MPAMISRCGSIFARCREFYRLNCTHSFTRRRVLGCGASVMMLGVRPTSAASTGPNVVVRQNRLYLHAFINGHPVLALLDSAAESSLVDSDFARRIGLDAHMKVEARGSGGDTEAELVHGVKIEALGRTLGPLTIAELDLSDVGRRLIGEPLPLILGREIFDAARLFVDIAHARIETRSRAGEPAGARLELKTEHGIETFPIRFENHTPVQAAFDLGNANEVLISADCAKKAGLLGSGRKVLEKRGGGIGGERLRKTFTLNSLELAGRTFTDVPAAIEENSSATDLNIGVAILKHFEITADFARHRLWLKPLAN
jgi:predicted aspartyl protease